jgi:2-octaprenyl-6-methoxyphenol hydroxylase
MHTYAAEVVIVGGGPAGLTAAIALAGAGVACVLIARPPPLPDRRTTALLASSVKALDTLGVWQHCREHAAPMRGLRLVDDTARLIRAPEVCFDAQEIGLDAFAHNIENRFLVAALADRARQLAALTIVEDEAEAIAFDDDGIAVRTRAGSVVSGRLAIGADGKRSLCRAAAGIDADATHYPQTALALNVAHSRPHHDTSTEFHTERGPFTLVPLPGQRSSVVWVTDPAEASRLLALRDADLSAEIERRAHSLLGKIEVEPGRGVFALAAETARRFAARRLVLIGEAAHVMAPIGAQGLNLGLRDAATVAELVVTARREGRDVGADDLTAQYDRIRRADVTSRTLAVDLLNRSLLSDFLPLQAARGLGLYLLEWMGPLRRALMREGVTPAASQPRLMRGEAL